MTLLCTFFLFTTGAFAQEKITVAFAANMEPVIRELSANFEKEHHCKVELVPGASGKLTAQIKEGAPYDIFVSADMNFPEELFKAGFTESAPKAYATGLLVLWSANADIHPSGDMKILLAPQIKKIAIANARTAPYGAAAEAVLKYYNLYDKVKDKLVFGENISQTEQFVETQAAEIGFIAKSFVMTDKLKNIGHWAEIDKKVYTPIVQGAVLLSKGKTGHNGQLVHQFFDYLYSIKAKSVLEKFGYLVP